MPSFTTSSSITHTFDSAIVSIYDGSIVISDSRCHDSITVRGVSVVQILRDCANVVRYRASSHNSGRGQRDELIAVLQELRAEITSELGKLAPDTVQEPQAADLEVVK